MRQIGHLYLSGVEAGSAVEDCLSSGLSSVGASELDDEAGGAVGAAVLGAGVSAEGCAAAGAALGCNNSKNTTILPAIQDTRQTIEVILGHIPLSIVFS